MYIDYRVCRVCYIMIYDLGRLSTVDSCRCFFNFFYYTFIKRMHAKKAPGLQGSYILYARARICMCVNRFPTIRLCRQRLNQYKKYILLLLPNKQGYSDMGTYFRCWRNKLQKWRGGAVNRGFYKNTKAVAKISPKYREQINYLTYKCNGYFKVSP